ncbi:MAG: hypothetical protein AAF627_10385 [Myxococcota bacterium]
MSDETLAALGYAARLVCALFFWWSPDREQLRVPAVVLVAGTVAEASLYEVVYYYVPIQLYLALRFVEKTHLVVFVLLMIRPTLRASVSLWRMSLYASLVPFAGVLVMWVVGTEREEMIATVTSMEHPWRLVAMALAAGAAAVEIWHWVINLKHNSPKRAHWIVLALTATDLVQVPMGQLDPSVPYYQVPGEWWMTVFLCTAVFAILPLRSEQELIRRAYRRRDAKLDDAE